MKLTVLGSGYFIPTEKRNNSGYLLEIGGESVLMDTGSGTLRQLITSGHSIWEISKIFYSHLHIDHLADLLPILFIRKYSESQGRNHDLQLYGHEFLKTVLEGFEQAVGQWIKNDERSYQVNPLTPGHYDFNLYELTVYKGIHADQSLMYRFQEKGGKSLLYTGDTDLSDILIAAARDVDVLLTEFSSTDKENGKGHLSPSKILTIINETRPQRVILSHLTPETEKREQVQTIDVPPGTIVELAEDLVSWDI